MQPQQPQQTGAAMDKSVAVIPASQAVKQATVRKRHARLLKKKY